MRVIIYLSKPTECITPRMNPNVNYGLWVMMTCQCRFMDYNKCPTLVQAVDSGEAVHARGQVVYKKSLYLLINFALNLKLL